MAMIKYWPYVMIQNASDKRAYVIGSYSACLSEAEAMKVINTHKEHNTVLCAWIRKMDKNMYKGTCFFENYTNAFGMVNDRFVREV